MSTAYVVPCGAAKLERPAPARELYTSAHFRLQLAAAAYAAGYAGDPVLILSARHGLVGLDAELEPYDVRMGDPGSVDVVTLAGQLLACGLTTVYALLPRAYYRALAAAAELVDVVVLDVYEGARGIGDHRAVCAHILRPRESADRR